LPVRWYLFSGKASKNKINRRHVFVLRTRLEQEYEQ